MTVVSLLEVNGPKVLVLNETTSDAGGPKTKVAAFLIGPVNGCGSFPSLENLREKPPKPSGKERKSREREHSAARGRPPLHTYSKVL